MTDEERAAKDRKRMAAVLMEVAINSDFHPMTLQNIERTAWGWGILPELQMEIDEMAKVMTDEERARARMWAAIVSAVNSQVMSGVDEAVDAFEAAIRADEREKCAKVADHHNWGEN